MRLKLNIKQQHDPRQQALLKKGNWTAITNQIIEKLLISAESGLTLNEIRVLIAVLRATIGRQKYSAQLSTSYIEKMTHGLWPRTIRIALASLERRKILILYKVHSRKYRRGKEWGVNFDDSTWCLGKQTEDKSAQRTKHSHVERTIDGHSERSNPHTNKERDIKDFKYTPSKKLNVYPKELVNDGVKYSI